MVPLMPIKNFIGTLGINTATSTAITGIPSSSSTGTGMSKAFETIYALIAVVTGFSVLAVFILSFIDIILFAINEGIQANTQINDKLLYTKDTTDLKALDYVGVDTTEDEPYHIYAIQQIIGGIFIAASFMVTLIAIQYAFYLSMMIYSKLNSVAFNESVELNGSIIIIVLVAAGGAFMLSKFYKMTFIKKTQNKLKSVRANIRAVKAYIYQNMTTNQNFLNALQTDDINSIITIIRTSLHKDDSNTCSDITHECSSHKDVEKMIFTYSLYSYYKYLVPESDDNYSEIMSMFTLQTITSHSVDPVKFLYYKQSLYIPNLYQTMRADIIGNQDSPQAFLNTNGGVHFDSNRESTFVLSLNAIMQKLNGLLSKLYTLPTGKINILYYLLIFFVCSLVFIIVMGGVSWKYIGPPLIEIIKKISAFFPKKEKEKTA
jgi:hypothetical protein